MLEKARSNGVLPPNWFRWLKTVDRVTWYALNDLGLDVASVEAAGIRAHWLAESMARNADRESDDRERGDRVEDLSGRNCR